MRCCLRSFQAGCAFPKEGLTYVHPDRRWKGRESRTKLEKAGDGGMELVNPSAACLPVFVWRGLQPKKAN